MGNFSLTGLFRRSEKCTPKVFVLFMSLHFCVIKFKLHYTGLCDHEKWTQKSLNNIKVHESKSLMTKLLSRFCDQSYWSHEFKVWSPRWSREPWYLMQQTDMEKNEKARKQWRLRAFEFGCNPFCRLGRTNFEPFFNGYEKTGYIINWQLINSGISINSAPPDLPLVSSHFLNQCHLMAGDI